MNRYKLIAIVVLPLFLIALSIAGLLMLLGTFLRMLAYYIMFLPKEGRKEWNTMLVKMQLK